MERAGERERERTICHLSHASIEAQKISDRKAMPWKETQRSEHALVRHLENHCPRVIASTPVSIRWSSWALLATRRPWAVWQNQSLWACGACPIDHCRRGGCPSCDQVHTRRFCSHARGGSGSKNLGCPKRPKRLIQFVDICCLHRFWGLTCLVIISVNINVVNNVNASFWGAPFRHNVKEYHPVSTIDVPMTFLDAWWEMRVQIERVAIRC